MLQQKTVANCVAPLRGNAIFAIFSRLAISMQIRKSFQKFVTSEEYKKYKSFYFRLNTVCIEHFELELLYANHVTPEIKKNYTFCTPQRSQIFEMASEFAHMLPIMIKFRFSHFPGAGRHN